VMSCMNTTKMWEGHAVNCIGVRKDILVGNMRPPTKQSLLPCSNPSELPPNEHCSDTLTQQKVSKLVNCMAHSRTITDGELSKIVHTVHQPVHCPGVRKRLWEDSSGKWETAHRSPAVSYLRLPQDLTPETATESMECMYNQIRQGPSQTPRDIPITAAGSASSLHGRVCVDNN
jgi:hypothetical protein